MKRMNVMESVKNEGNEREEEGDKRFGENMGSSIYLLSLAQV